MNNDDRNFTVKNSRRDRRSKQKKKGKYVLSLVLLGALASSTYYFGGSFVDFYHNLEAKFSGETQLSEVKPVVEEPVVSDPEPAKERPKTWNLILVNPWNRLPDDFQVERTQLAHGHSFDKRAYPDLQEMMDDARAQGFSPTICSSYRSMEKQTTLFNNKVQKYVNQGYSEVESEEMAAKWVAIPGTSEHHTGLAVDIVAVSYQVLDKKQEETPEQKWLHKNSYKYGFILRYPEDKEEITGISYEPWHYRYVGKDAAKEIYESNVCLEEYLQG